MAMANILSNPRALLALLASVFLMIDAEAVSTGHQGHLMPGKPSPQASPSPTPLSSPTPSPTQMEMNMPGMQRPSPSPSPQATPMPGMEMNMPTPVASPSPGQMESMRGMENMPAISAMNMGPLVVMSGHQMAIRVGSSPTNTILMGQMGSGTSWQPASTPMYMMHKVAGDWLLMFHYNLFAGVNSQGGPRGVTKFESANWFMPMAFHRLGKGTLELRGMLSFEPFTFPRGGSPLLFQTGETFNGQPLIDRQHPHDLFMELSATYTVPIGERAKWFAYAGMPGEPALGPTAFMHRASASENPSAPLSHHLQDSTHISWGVFTTGFTYRWLKLEGSVFNGREPDENRYNFEFHAWDSRSVRLSFVPNNNWSMQLSHSFLRNPEALEPGTTHRTTASISYNKPFRHGNWATSLIWGRNHENHGPNQIFNLNGYIVESTLNFFRRNYVYTRLELTDKNELLRPEDRLRLGIVQDHPSFRIGAYTFGGARDLWNAERFSLAIGGDVTFYSKPSVLDVIYGNHPTSYRVFLRLRPSKMSMEH